MSDGCWWYLLGTNSQRGEKLIMSSGIKTGVFGLRLDSPKTRMKKIMFAIIAIAVAVFFMFPLYWLLMTSFKSNHEVLGTSLIPHYPTIAPWVDQLTSRDFLQTLYNSVLISTIAMSISFVLGVTASYGMARYYVPGRSGIMLTFLVTQMMPASLLLMPMFLVFSQLNWLNTYQAPAIAITTGSIPFIVVTLRPYFLSIPQSLDDAARIDGCNAFTSFILVIMPIIRTGLITILVITFLHGWNDLIYSMTFNTDDAMRPLTANIRRFQDQFGVRWNFIMAYGMILVTPVTLAFIFLQKHIIGGLTQGAVKE